MPSRIQLKVMIHDRAGVVMSFITPVTSFTLNEPICVDVLIQNNSTETVQLDLGHNYKSNFEFSVVEPHGSMIQLPQLSDEGFGLIGRLSLQPQEQYDQKLLLNEWYPFTGLGRYTIEGKLSSPIVNYSGVLVSAELSDTFVLQVDPRNSERLKQICQNLTEIALRKTKVEEANEAALELSYIQDPIAIPYLEQILERGKTIGSHAINGLGRIANAEASTLLISIARHGEQEIASLARFVLYELKEKTQDSTLKDRIQAVLQF